jgi:hypothetical protein
VIDIGPNLLEAVKVAAVSVCLVGFWSYMKVRAQQGGVRSNGRTADDQSADRGSSPRLRSRWRDVN